MKILNFEKMLDSIVTEQLLLQIGESALLIIKKRTEAGEFLPGSTPGSEKYSTKPFVAPVAALRGTGKTGLWQKLKKGEEVGYFRRSGLLWAVVKGGYAGMRELAGRAIGKVNLRWSGQMMRSLQIVDTNTKEGTVTLGFTMLGNAQIADYHQNKGAGKGKVIRKFVGLTEAEISRLGGKLSRSIKFKI